MCMEPEKLMSRSVFLRKTRRCDRQFRVPCISGENVSATFKHMHVCSELQVTITRAQRGSRQRPWGFVSETCWGLNFAISVRCLSGAFANFQGRKFGFASREEAMLAAEEALLGQAATGAGTDFTGRFAGGEDWTRTARCALRGPLKVKLINFAEKHICELRTGMRRQPETGSNRP